MRRKIRTKKPNRHMKWFKRASGQGSGEGSAAIAELYEQGLGVTKSSEEAKAWWELGAKQGYEQELDVRCFTRTPDAGSLICEPLSDGSGCPTSADMETLRASGVTGRLKPTGGGGGRFRLGPKARALIVLDHRITSEEGLKQPRHTNIIYAQHETSWVHLPTNAPLLDRPIVLSPQPDAPQFTKRWRLCCVEITSRSTDQPLKLGKIWEITPKAESWFKSHRINGPHVLLRAHKTKVS